MLIKSLVAAACLMVIAASGVFLWGRYVDRCEAAVSAGNVDAANSCESWGALPSGAGLKAASAGLENALKSLNEANELLKRAP